MSTKRHGKKLFNFNKLRALAALSACGLVLALAAPSGAQAPAKGAKARAAARADAKAPARGAPSRAQGKADAAQPEDSQAPAAGERRVLRLDFDDDELFTSPDQGAGEVVTGERRGRISSLITVREDFIPELVKSAEDL